MIKATPGYGMVTKHQRKQNRTNYSTHFQRTQHPQPAKTFHSCKCNFNPKNDVLCLSETWLTKSVPNETLFLNNFQIFRNDRTSTEIVSKHGGVLIAVRRDINTKQLTLDHTIDDAITVLLTEKTKAQKLLISCIYNPPKNSPYRWPPEKCAQLLTSLKTKRKQLKVSSSIITGDINFVHTFWRSMQSTDGYENTVTDQLANLNYEQKFDFQFILGSKPQ